MTEPLLPGPIAQDGDNPDHRADGQRKSQPNGDRAHARYPNVEECLRAIAQPAGLLATGLLKPPQANAIRASYREILQHHRQTQVRQDRSIIGDADILDLMAKDPSILNMLSPILTDEQVDMIMKRSKGESGGTT